VVENSIGQNFGCMLELYRGPFVEGEPVYVAVDYAVAIRPGAACGGAQVEPTPTQTQVVVPTHTATQVVVPTITLTPVPTATDTGVPVATATLTQVPVATATHTEVPVATATLTEVPLPTATLTQVPVPSATHTNTPVIRRMNGILIMKYWPASAVVHSRRLLRGLMP